MTGRFGWLVDVADRFAPGIRETFPAEFPSSANEAWDLAMRACGTGEEELVAAVAEHFSLSPADLDRVSPVTLKLVPFTLALQHHVLPLAVEGNALVVAVCDPTDAETLAKVRFASGRQAVTQVQSPGRIETAVLRLYGEVAQREARETVELDAAPVTEAERDPIVRLARQLLRMAAERQASDLHMQPYMGGYLVRARVDGVLARLSTLTHDVGAHVVRHLKATAYMDSTDPYTPQDGRCTVYLGDQRFDLRLSSVPNAQGERLVIRFLRQSRVHSLEQLGYAPSRAQALRRITQLESGLVLFVGPTGCGKTTSLFALLSSLNSMERSIATIEDPVEYVLPGLSQVDVRPDRGVTFASALRAQLRQDPDVLLIGEIRDQETAEAATRAAMTGHLVFSTLHTSAARYAVPRLLELGVSAPLIGETLMAVVSQRLFRKPCPACATSVTGPLTPAERLFEEITKETPRVRAMGCEQCAFVGYRGVTPVIELYLPSACDRTGLMSGSPSPSIWDVDATRLETGNPDDRSMPLCVLDMVVSGVTTVEEGDQVLGRRLWTALARHFKHVGWFDGSTSDAALSARSETEAEILVIGAHPSFVVELAGHLRDFGYRVVDVDSSVNARQLLSKHANAGLLLFDLEGDDSRATDMLRELRRNFAWTGIPAVILVPPEAPELRQALEPRLANRVVIKPIAAAKVAEIIRSLAWGDA